ncbi:MAG: hypothetical protein ABR925_01335 [Acidimicrobiales bacterium]
MAAIEGLVLSPGGLSIWQVETGTGDGIGSPGKSVASHREFAVDAGALSRLRKSRDVHRRALCCCFSCGGTMSAACAAFPD